MLGSGLFVAVATVAANGLNAGFQVALARILSPAEYSLLLSLIVVTLIAAVPPLAFQASVAREVAVSLAEDRRDEAGAAIRGTVRGLSVWAVAVVVVGVAVSPFVGWGALATAVTIAGALVIPAVWGGLLGARLFLVYGVAQLTFAGTRFAAGLGIGLAGGGAAAVMAGVAAATVLTLVLTALPQRDLLAGGGRARRAGRLATLPNAAAATGLTVLMALATIDVLVAKLSFSVRATPAPTASRRSAPVCCCSCRSASSRCCSRAWQRCATGRASGATCSQGSRSSAGLGGLTTAFLWVFADPLVTADLRREVRGGGSVARAAVTRDGALRADDGLPLPLPLARAGRGSRSCSS